MIPEVLTLLKAMMIGFLVSMPVGFVGIICITRTLEHGFKAGFAVGLGSAFSDVIFTLIAGTSLTFIAQFLEEKAEIIQLLGAFILGIIAGYGLRKDPPALDSIEETTSPSYIKSTLLIFLMTVTNPLNIIGYIAIFSLFGINFTPKQMPFVMIGIFLGAMMWWTILSFISNSFRQYLSLLTIHKVRRVFLIVLLMLAIIGAVSSFLDYFTLYLEIMPS